jgi:hypothetical protein
MPTRLAEQRQQLADTPHGTGRHDLLEDSPPLGEVGVARGRVRGLRAEPGKPLLVVPFAPGADHPAPFVDGQRDAAPLVDPPVRLVFRCFAVEDDAVEVEDHGGDWGLAIGLAHYRTVFPARAIRVSSIEISDEMSLPLMTWPVVA